MLGNDRHELFFGWHDGIDGAAIEINPSGVPKFYIDRKLESRTGDGAITGTSLISVNRSGPSAAEPHVNGVAI